MPSVKIPRKSTVTDMTPFVDVAFLILAFFMLATKFKPPEPVTISTPTSVSADKLTETNSVKVEFDSTGRIFFSMNVKNPDDDPVLKRTVIENINSQRNLGLNETEIQNFIKNTIVGVPFSQLKKLLDVPGEGRNTFPQTGIPADSTNNELAVWIGVAKKAFFDRDPNMEVLYMIKGDNDAKFPSFNGVVEAMRKNDQFRYKLVTDPKEAPVGTELYKMRASGMK